MQKNILTSQRKQTQIDGRHHAWVLTIDTEGYVTLWESLTGVRYPLSPSSGEGKQQRRHKFEHVHTVFNHREFYGNIQADSVCAPRLVQPPVAIF